MISIIVPVYNTKKYLQRCIESIIHQIYTNWELILVDDGSYDGSEQICDDYACKDKRIKVIHSVNKGASSARNKGLNIAKGDWITFVDADDWIEPQHIQCFVNQINNQVDLCINSFITDLKYGAKPFHYPKILTENNIQSIEVFFTRLRLHSQFLWNKVFKKTYIDKYNIRFDESLSLGEDNVFILQYISHVKRLSSSSICTYHYDQIDENPLSLGRRKHSIKEMQYQLQTNCNAILSLYAIYGLPILFEYASNYYYDRVFRRLIVPNVRRIFCFFLPPVDPLKYIRSISKLDSSKITDNAIRLFWKYTESNNILLAFVALNIYLIKTWSKSRIIESAVVVRHVLRNVRSIAFH